MINWLTQYIGTASYIEGYRYCEEYGFTCLDVRDLVDKRGNTQQSIRVKIEDGIKLLGQGNKIVVCCDYGMSRSNSIAIGIIVKYENRSFENVVEDVVKIVGKDAIKPEVLHTVRISLDQQEITEKESVVLVTGAAGFIGRSLVAELENDGHKTIALSSNEINLEEDIIKLDLLVTQVRPTHIVHLANPKIYTNNAAMGKTLIMMKNILDICTIHKINLIYPSSWEVYSGYASEGLCASENLPLFPKGTYGETKYLCEQLIKNRGIQDGLSYAIVRLSPVYGAKSERPKFIYNFINKALNNEPIITHNYHNGSPQLDLLYIDDAVKALNTIITQNLIGDYNIGTGNIISTNRVAELIVEAASSTSSIFHNNIDEYAPNIIMDASKLKRQTGWRTTMCFENWILDLIKSIIQNR
ncbi:MAG: NAD-dependent epimerase/dehydratase family protein [Clostridiaceae bacterium]|nr:NAD-dependent epimerase/dehydratase family protein [Clostridiaceae bacterium]